MDKMDFRNDKWVRIKDICHPESSGLTTKDIENSEGPYPVYGASGFIKNISFARQKHPYIAVVKDGSGVGRVMKLPENSSILGTMQYIIPNNGINIDYLRYGLEYSNLSKFKSGAAIPHIYFRDYGELRIRNRSEKEQSEIGNSLRKIEDTIDKYKRISDLLEDIVKSRFIELFEKDGQNNQIVQLEEIAGIVSGITKGRKIKSKDFTNVPYMAVSNVKDGYIDLSNLKSIEATKEEIDKYHLISGDILMTEGGDPDKLGRGSIIIDPPKNCIHQNHIFRVRLDPSVIDPVYFSAYLQQPISKKYFLRSAKQTTGIASINMKQLRGMPVIIPSLEDQKEYKNFFLSTAKSKLDVDR